MRVIGRERDLTRLDTLLDRVTRSGRGTLVALRGRRQVGKSTLVQAFLDRRQVPSLFFTAVAGERAPDALARFDGEARSSTLRWAASAPDVTFRSWLAALMSVAASIAGPTVIVIDELPFLLAADPAVEGMLQAAWDRALGDRPVLVVLIGSDIAMMEALASHDRPLYGRVRELVVSPLDLAGTSDLIGWAPADIIDLHLVCGGFPRLLLDVVDDGHETLDHYVEDQLSDATMPLVVNGERMLRAEFPANLQAVDALAAIGWGMRTFTDVSTRTGIGQASLDRALRLLADSKGVVTRRRPLSADTTRLTAYEVADPYLRFWLRFVGPGIHEISRGRGDLVLARIQRDWGVYRGLAVEPIVRSSIERVLPDGRFGSATTVGSYWNRTGDVEVDLVGADRADPPATVAFAGSIKWRDNRPFDRTDALDLVRSAARVPGGAPGLPLVGVARSGFADGGLLDVALGPADLIAAWR